MKLTSALEKLLFTSIRIETKLPNCSYVSGTAFVYDYTTPDNSYPFLITARHLIKNATEGRITLIQGENRAPLLGKGYTLDIENFSKLWFSHPDSSLNIAVTPFVPFVKHVENSGVSVFFNTLNNKSIADANQLASLEPTDDAVYLGYPNHCWDKKHLLPVYRKGMIASSLQIDFDGKPQLLLDTNITEGSSGSPVFINSGELTATTDAKLLGVLSVLPDDEAAFQKSMSGDSDVPPIQKSPMGVVIKMDAAVEAITAYLKEKGFI